MYNTTRNMIGLHDGLRLANDAEQKRDSDGKFGSGGGSVAEKHDAQGDYHKEEANTQVKKGNHDAANAHRKAMASHYAAAAAHKNSSTHPTDQKHASAIAHVHSDKAMTSGVKPGPSGG